MMLCRTVRTIEGEGGAHLVVRRCCAVAVLMLASWAAVASTAVTRDAEVPVRIPLAPMGFQTLSSEFLLAGSSMMTVNFVDSGHLLITFSLRRLMKRDPGDPPDDQDRVVGAYLVEVASGKVLARTEWRLHDRSQYLWKLGRGRFLLRVRDRLTVIAPMDSGDPDNAFREIPLITVDRHIVAILVSSDDDLLTVETTRFSMGAAAAGEGFSAEPAPVQINFYRLMNAGPSLEGLRAISAGVVRSRTAVAVPMTGAGTLELLDGGKDRWLFNFDEHSGKVHELAEWDSSCFPRPTFVGPSEFVAFGCRGSADKLDIAGFNMKGQEMWEQGFFDAYVAPTFDFAPAAGRFALGRTIVSTSLEPDALLTQSVVNGQEVRVYQTSSGKQVFKIDCSPVQRAGQNFALSEDGMRLAVVRDTLVRHGGFKDFGLDPEHEVAVEVYTLPPLSKEDVAAVKDAEAMAPPVSEARIDVALQREAAAAAAKASGAGAAAVSQSESGDVPPPVAPEDAGTPGASSAPTEPAEEAPSALGDAVSGAGTGSEPTAPRKPPTLYGPDEKKPPEKSPH
jgi:hypothetical protein